MQEGAQQCVRGATMHKVCNNALRNKRVARDFLIDGVEVLEKDGNITLLELQKKGYQYIKI